MLALVVWLLAAAPALACEDISTVGSFEAWGDPAGYAPVPGGSFENGLSWSTSGAPALEAASHPFGLPGTTGTQAVRLRKDDEITSPAFCIDRLHTHVRYVVRSLDGNSAIKLEALWTRSDGERDSASFADQGAAGAEWGLSRVAALSEVLPSDLPAGVEIRSLQLRFSTEGRRPDLLVDDVQIAVLPTPRCPGEVTSSPVFARWGDPSQYVEMPGGRFEGRSADWTFAGSAEIVESSNPFDEAAARDRC